MLNNKDFQFRLMKKQVKWQNKVHEVPETLVNNKNKIAVMEGIYIVHPKDLKRQQSQNNKYDEIMTKQIPERNNKLGIIYDSVIWTLEGITEHARQEILELKRRGYTIQIINDIPRNEDKIENNEELKELLKPIDCDKYITILNQPPIRWNRSYNLPNLVGYLAFEGNLIKEWVDTINNSPIIELWTCSNYCKDKFIESGVKKPIFVIPHGINPNVWKNYEFKKDKDVFRFLWAGTAHNTRKGLSLLVHAFSEEFAKDKNVELVVKANKIYDKNQDIHKLIYNSLYPQGSKNINIIEEDLTEKEFVELMNMCDVYVSPHYSEGFGIIMLEALATGTPLIATRSTGNLDFCNDNNTLFIETKGEKWADWTYPYFDTKWKCPDIDSLKKQLRYAYNNFKEIKENSLKQSEIIQKNNTWEKTVDLIERRIEEIKRKI